MGLIEKFRQATALQPIDPDSLSIKEGQLVTLTAAGVKRVALATVNNVYGIAADTFSTSSSAMPGVYPGWQNRVSDGFDETKASGKITVYHSGGEFATDQFSNTSSLAGKEGQILIANSAGVLTFGYADQGAAIAASKQSVAMLTKAPAVMVSGVPGVDVQGGANAPDYGDIALKGQQVNDGQDPTDPDLWNNLWIEIKLLV